VTEIDMTSEQQRNYWTARISSIVHAASQRGARAVGTLIAVTGGVWGYGGDAVALELDVKDDRGLRHLACRYVHCRSQLIKEKPSSNPRHARRGFGIKKAGYVAWPRTEEKLYDHPITRQPI
jgi:hypothetical protein